MFCLMCSRNRGDPRAPVVLTVCPISGQRGSPSIHQRANGLTGVANS